jgi:hypothetical protein
MHGNHANTSTATAAQAMTIDPIRAVEEAAAMNTYADFEHEHSAPELQAAVARAVTYGAQIKDVANAAHMTSLEVLDAADSLTYPGRRSG